MDYIVSEINEYLRFLELNEEWNVLLTNSICNIPFLRHEWICTWWKYFGVNQNIRIITIKKNNRLVFALPLIEYKLRFFGLKLTVLQSMCNSHSFRYCFLLLKDEDHALNAFIDYINKVSTHWHILYLKQLPSDIKTTEMLSDSIKHTGFRYDISYSADVPYVDIKNGWDSYVKTLKSKFKSNLRNRVKRLASVGDIEFYTYTAGDNILDILREGMDIEKRGWKGEERTAIACNPILIGFYSEWALVAAKNGWLRLSFLKINKKPVAFDYSLQYAESVYCMKIGYDPDYAQYSVGQLLCYDILRKCFEMSATIKKYDFLGESSVQKRDWTSTSQKEMQIYVYNNNALSFVHYYYNIFFKNTIRKFRSQL